MRITRKMLETRIHDINNDYNLNLRISYFNGCTWLYHNDTCIEANTTPKCYESLNVFMTGFFAGRE